MQAGPGMAEVISIVKFTRVEFTMEITSSVGHKKRKIDENGLPNPRKWGPGAHPGPGWHPDSKKHQKHNFTQACLEGVLETFRYFLGGCFFMFLLEGPFSLPGCHLGAQGPRKGARRSPKVSKKVV